MQTFTTDYAVQHFDELLALVENGETILLFTAGRPVARLLPTRADGDADVPSAEVEEAFYGD
ncbi:MAG TPA: hypothetical protein DDY14_01280 [Chromatiaceae bacterium]|nr:MAG: hypothetical protein N838_08490 [Thiohalocapsa sp. PB-PSB1]QQO57293.1 MAG: hypothetical protein N838_32015 [Thiohalocapsa sp. PB-PSB1]HBG93964.1 hypothetical protein [Chromatiaceae bacterium]HCS92308.1 hypothetical protein [Chromatiaceae bacterium]